MSRLFRFLRSAIERAEVCKIAVEWTAIRTAHALDPQLNRDRVNWVGGLCLWAFCGLLKGV